MRYKYKPYRKKSNEKAAAKTAHNLGTRPGSEFHAGPPPKQEYYPEEAAGGHVEEIRIPLPSEEVDMAGEPALRQRKRRLSDIFRIRIGIEELLLTALILLLFQEGMEDDFLPVMLLYILLF